MRNTLFALQVFSAFVVTLFGLAKLCKAPDDGERLLAAFLAAIGFTFLSLLLVNLRKGSSN